jgi:HSP20 family molecular chaperone IbpA
VVERSRLGPFAALEDFERRFEALFDDLLISRWRRPVQARDVRNTHVTERSDHYEVRMTRLAADVRQVDLEASDRRLVVRSLGPAGPFERVVEFQHTIDPEAATARFENGTLTIILPKKPARKIWVA